MLNFPHGRSIFAMMKKLLPITMFALTMVSLAHHGYAQGTLEPLYLSFSGDGTVSPLQNGQLLEVGQSYEMDATAAAGYIFSGWQQVNVFTVEQVTVNSDGGTNSTTMSTVASVNPEIYASQPALDFTMQPVNLLYNVPGVEEITQGSGWQADFSPVPEPTSATLVIAGLTAITLLQRRSRHRRRSNQTRP